MCGQSGRPDYYNQPRRIGATMLNSERCPSCIWEPGCNLSSAEVRNAIRNTKGNNTQTRIPVFVFGLFGMWLGNFWPRKVARPAVRRGNGQAPGVPKRETFVISPVSQDVRPCLGSSGGEKLPRWGAFGTLMACFGFLIQQRCLKNTSGVEKQNTEHTHFMCLSVACVSVLCKSQTQCFIACLLMCRILLFTHPV